MRRRGKAASEVARVRAANRRMRRGPQSGSRRHGARPTPSLDLDIKISLYPHMALVPRIFAALADPTRLRIVMLLRAMELSVGELAQVLGQSQPRVSRHVRILIDAGLAERRKEGSWVFLSLGPRPRTEPLFQLIERWAEHDGDNPWFAADAARLAAVRADRAAAAERYFSG